MDICGLMENMDRVEIIESKKKYGWRYVWGCWGCCVGDM